MTLHLLTIFLSFIVVLHTQLFDPNEIQTDVDNLRAFPNSPFGFNNPRNIETPNLVDYGQQFGDLEISSNQQANGMTIRLYKYFPFYTGKYNYTMVSLSLNIPPYSRKFLFFRY
ncbi:hypothetical protein AB6A40_007774 [Gnathostoma spinigerum]|uniref:Uncharacterized protein n=1 Tax=Gnathostoma spinigerum TaxID=75299 RepID=A0ABD6EM84_9BILA